MWIHAQGCLHPGHSLVEIPKSHVFQSVGANWEGTIWLKDAHLAIEAIFFYKSYSELQNNRSVLEKIGQFFLFTLWHIDKDFKPKLDWDHTWSQLHQYFPQFAIPWHHQLKYSNLILIWCKPEGLCLHWEISNLLHAVLFATQADVSPTHPISSSFGGRIVGMLSSMTITWGLRLFCPNCPAHCTKSIMPCSEPMKTTTQIS